MNAPFIAVVDLETTGFEPPAAEVIEIACCRLLGDRDLFDTPVWANTRIGTSADALARPTGLIPPETSAIHHLIDDDVRDAMPWASICRTWAAFTTDAAALAAHSASFERQWLTPEAGFNAPWICTYKCALRAWPDAPGHSNQTLRYWLRPAGLDREMGTPAHRAAPDAYVTAHLLRELLKLHTLDDLIAWSNEPALLVRAPFGKSPERGGSRGMRWTEVDDGLLEWTLGTDMGEDILFTAAHELARREAERKAKAEEVPA